MRSVLPALCALLLGASGARGGDPAGEYRRRVDVVRKMPGFVALWDFVKRDAGAGGRFAAHQRKEDPFDYRLDAVNYVHDAWGEGRPASYDDFPLLGRGPFGQAVCIRKEARADFRPCLLVPRERLHNSGLDVKGAGQSVSMVAWVIRESGNHAIAGIWYEGTERRRGMRQYAIFAGLAGNPGASAAHVSENGANSFGDRYARNLAVTPEVIPAVPADAPPDTLDAAWTVVGFSFDAKRKTVTAYFDGKASEFWIEDPGKHPFYQWPYRGWLNAQYTPPEGKPRKRTVLSRQPEEQVELHEFEFTRVRVTLHTDKSGRFRQVVSRELVALRANPFWFGHDIYSPSTPADGGPLTIGRVIHASRSVGFTGYIGGVAVFRNALSASQMRGLAAFGRGKGGALSYADLRNVAARSPSR